MPLTIHHLHVSQSERIPWLCEELNITYNLKEYTRAPFLAPPEYKALHPQGTAPIIQDGEVTLAESCAVIEYISRKYADGKLFLPPSHPAYAEFLYWWHWADGTFQPSIGRLMQARFAGLTDEHQIVAMAGDRFRKALGALDKRLGGNEWLSGQEFTVADIMVVFSLSTMRYFYGYSLGDYQNVLKYLERISGREGYQRAMKKCDPEMELALNAEPPRPFAG